MRVAFPIQIHSISIKFTPFRVAFNLLFNLDGVADLKVDLAYNWDMNSSFYVLFIIKVRN